MDYTKDVRLKQLIAKIILDNDINVKILCRNANVRYGTFVMWLNANKHYNIGHDHFEELMIRRICKQLGISIRVRYIVSKIPEADLMFLRDRRTNERKSRFELDLEYLRNEVKKLENDEEEN